MNFESLINSATEYPIYKQNIKFQKSISCLEDHWSEQLFFVKDIYNSIYDIFKNETEEANKASANKQYTDSS